MSLVAAHTPVTRKRAVLAVSCLTSFVMPFMASAVGVAIPTIGRDLAMTAVASGWIATAYLLAMTSFLVPFGRLADIVGRKRVFVWGMTIFVAGSALVALAWSGAALIAWRVMQGVGIAMSAGTSVAMLTAVYPERERGGALGLNAAAVYVGLSAGPVVSGVLTYHFGWRSIFAVNVPIGLATLAVTLPMLRRVEWTFARGERFDLLGSILYTASLPALVYGLSRIGEVAGPPLLAVGAAGLVGFVAWELRARSPILRVRLFVDNTAFRYSNLATLASYAAASATGFLMSFYLQYIKGLNPRDAGLLLVCQPVVQAALSPPAGRLSDRVEPRVLASAGMAVCCAALVALAFVSETTSTAVLVVELSVMGLGFALFSSPNTNAVMSSVERRWASIAVAIVATMRVLGQTMSLGVVTVLLAVFVGDVAVTPAVHVELLAGIRVAFIVFAVVCAAGVLASLARGQVHAASDGRDGADAAMSPGEDGPEVRTTGRRDP
jgi:EmrB/QacA subfamily drug resistance transporter